MRVDQHRRKHSGPDATTTCTLSIASTLPVSLGPLRQGSKGGIEHAMEYQTRRGVGQFSQQRKQLVSKIVIEHSLTPPRHPTHTHTNTHGWEPDPTVGRWAGRGGAKAPLSSGRRPQRGFPKPTPDLFCTTFHVDDRRGRYSSSLPGPRSRAGLTLISYSTGRSTLRSEVLCTTRN